MPDAPASRAQNDPKAAVFLKGQYRAVVVEVLPDLLVKSLFISPRADIHERFVIVPPVEIHVPGDVWKLTLAKYLAQKFPNEARSIFDYRFGLPERKECFNVFALRFDSPVNQSNHAVALLVRHPHSCFRLKGSTATPSLQFYFSAVR